MLGFLWPGNVAMGDGLPEYRLKAAFIFNFIAYTQWPNDLGSEVNLCMIGEHGFGEEIEALKQRKVNQLGIELAFKKYSDNLQDCEVIYVANDAMRNLPQILKAVEHKHILTIADTENAISRGIMLNMLLEENRVVFEANQKVARDAGLTLNARLLRLAAKVYQ